VAVRISAGREFQAAGPATVNAPSASLVLVLTTAKFPRMSSYNIACRISEVFEDVATSLNRQKLPSSTTPNILWRPRPGEHPRISTWTLIYFQKLECLAYIFAADIMGLSPFKFVQWAPKDASILQQSAGRKRILTWTSHSRSFILQSVTGRQGVACRHIILLALSLKISKK